MNKRHVVASGPRAGQWDVCHAKISCQNGGMHLDESVLKTISQKTYTAVKDLTFEDVQQYIKDHPSTSPAPKLTLTVTPEPKLDEPTQQSGPPPLIRMQLELSRLASGVRTAETQGSSEEELKEKRIQYQEKLTAATSHLERIYAQEGREGVEKVAEEAPGMRVLCHDVIDSHARFENLYEDNGQITQASYDGYIGGRLASFYEWNRAARAAQAPHLIAERKRAQRDVLTSMRVVAETKGPKVLRGFVQESQFRHTKSLALYASEAAMRSRPSYVPQVNFRDQANAEDVATQVDAVLDIVMTNETDTARNSTNPGALMRAPLTKITTLNMYKDAIEEYRVITTSSFPEATNKLTSPRRQEADLAIRAVMPDSVAPNAFVKNSFNPNVQLLLLDVKDYETKQRGYLNRDPQYHSPEHIQANKMEMNQAAARARQSLRLLALATKKEDLGTMMSFLRREIPDFMKEA